MSLSKCYTMKEKIQQLVYTIKRMFSSSNNMLNDLVINSAVVQYTSKYILVISRRY